MLFITYWELNEGMPLEEALKISQKVMSSGLVPSDGFKILRWDMTPDGWGITIAEAESAADVDRAVYMWRAAGAGFFKTTKTAPAQPIQDVIEQHGALLKIIRAA